MLGVICNSTPLSFRRHISRETPNYYWALLSLVANGSFSTPPTNRISRTAFSHNDAIITLRYSAIVAVGSSRQYPLGAREQVPGGPSPFPSLCHYCVPPRWTRPLQQAKSPFPGLGALRHPNDSSSGSLGIDCYLSSTERPPRCPILLPTPHQPGQRDRRIQRTAPTRWNTWSPSQDRCRTAARAR